MRRPKGQTDEMNHLNRPWQMERWCGPAQQGLVHKNRRKLPHLETPHLETLHLETCSMQPVGWRTEPSMAIPAVHIAPPGTNSGLPEGCQRAAREVARVV